MEILGVLLAFVGFALGIYEIINTLRGKQKNIVWHSNSISWLRCMLFSVSKRFETFWRCIFVWADFLCNKSPVRFLKNGR